MSTQSSTAAAPTAAAPTAAAPTAAAPTAAAPTAAAPTAAAPTAAAPSVDQTATPVSKTFDAKKSYGTPAKLLNLNLQESSGNPYAINPDTKAMGHYQFLPDTAAALNKQGIKFNPFNPEESRAAADYQIQQLVKQNGGDYRKAGSIWWI